MNDAETIFKQILADPSHKWLPLNNQLIWTRAEVKNGRVLLVFDLLDCGIRLSDEARELLENVHQEYCIRYFKKSRSAESEVGAIIVRVHVLKQHAHDWFRSIITVLTDRKNLVESN